MFVFRSIISFVIFYILNTFVKCDPFLKYRATYLTSNYHEYFHSATDKNYNSTKNIYKLPQTTKPLSYNLTICPELSGNFNFSGTVEIEILVEDTTSDIYLHSSGLDIKGVNVKKKTGTLKQIS